MNKITGIKAISFDADGTLWDFEKVMRHSLDCVLKELQQVDPQAAASLDIDRMIEIRNRVADELKGKVKTHEEVRLQAFKQTLVEAGKPDDALASHLNQVFFEHRFKDIELFDDVLPTLGALKEKYPIGLLSNGNSYPERCGLDGVFQFVVFSQAYGVDKPDPRLFHIVADKAGCFTYDMLHIGDSLRNDFIGATGAGMKSIWLNRSQNKPEAGINLDYEIRSLTELLNIL